MDLDLVLKPEFILKLWLIFLTENLCGFKYALIVLWPIGILFIIPVLLTLEFWLSVKLNSGWKKFGLWILVLSELSLTIFFNSSLFEPTVALVPNIFLFVFNPNLKLLHKECFLSKSLKFSNSKFLADFVPLFLAATLNSDFLLGLFIGADSNSFFKSVFLKGLTEKALGLDFLLLDELISLFWNACSEIVFTHK